MTGTMLISALILSLKPKQTEPTLVLTLNQPRSTVLSLSLIKSLKLSSSGKNLYEADNIHKGIFIKNLLDFSDDFSRSVAKNQFWYLDTDATTATDNNATNLGMRARALLSHEGLIVKTIIPLNRYSFEGLSDKLLPPLQLEFEIVVQNDPEMIFQNDGTARRIVVRKFELWVPQLHFTGMVKDRPLPKKIS